MISFGLNFRFHFDLSRQRSFRRFFLCKLFILTCEHRIAMVDLDHVSYLLQSKVIRRYSTFTYFFSSSFNIPRENVII